MATRERPAFARWLLSQRQRLSAERGRKVRQVDVINEIRSSGYPIRDDYYRAIESGAKRPGRETREVLGRYFGSQPPMQDDPAPGNEELIAALREQTAAINRLVTALEAQSDPEALAERLGEALASHLEPLLAVGRVPSDATPGAPQ